MHARKFATGFFGVLWLVQPVWAEQESERIRQQIAQSGLSENIETISNYYSGIQQKLSGSIERAKPMDEQEMSRVQSTLQTLTSLNGRNSLATQMPDEPLPNRGTTVSGSLNRFDRDPFAITREMIDGSAQLEASLDFVPIEKPVFTVPSMTLRGLVRKPDGEMAALLEIEDLGVRVVREGDTIGLQSRGDEAAIRIKEVNALQVIVEAGKVGKVIVVR
jgi:hypothetical protein